MSTFKTNIQETAKSKQKILVLPEGTESRTQKAARILMDRKIPKQLILLGNRADIEKTAAENGVDLAGMELKDPAQSSHLTAYAKEYYNLRKHKGVTEADAKTKMEEPLSHGAMMVRMDEADAVVAGAVNSTGKVLIAGFTIIGTAEGVKSASSCFVMDLPNRELGEEGLFIFGDCGTIIDPTAEQLAEITTQSADSCRNLLNKEPLVAMLSFSTKGSAQHESIDKVLKALELVKKNNPDLKVDGELQLDAAIVPSVAASKAPDSPIGGRANTLIFPELQSGNIGYKLVQRLAGADAYGPILQGFAKPICDLSRGSTVEDIVNTCAITLAQC